jgi:hypothetical protein
MVKQAKRELKAAMAALELENIELRRENAYLERRVEEESRRLANG